MRGADRPARARDLPAAFEHDPPGRTSRQRVVERRCRHQNEIGGVALRDRARGRRRSRRCSVGRIVEVRRDRREQRGLEHVAVAEREEPVPTLSVPQRTVTPAAISSRTSVTPRRIGLPSPRSCRKRFAAGSATTVTPARAIFSISALAAAALERRQHAEMAQRDAALQAARDHRIGDHAREHAVRLEMLVEVEIDRQPGLLRQIEQRRERARADRRWH